MKIITFDDGQNGSEWLEWRRNGVGASDIGVIMKSNPYKTVLQLWEEKNNFRGEEPLNPAMAHGIKNESKAREWLNKNEQLNLQPICIEDQEHSFFRASLDGYDSDKKVLCEIKCPVNDEVLDKARNNQSLPKYWIDQIQWQIMLCKPVRAFVAIWDYRYDSCVTIEAFAQMEVQERMRDAAREFWRMVQMGITPKPDAKDYISIEDEQLAKILQEYKDHTDVAKAAESRKKQLRELIAEYGEEGNFVCNGFKVTKCLPRVVYDLDKMRMDGIDVDGYAKSNNGNGYYKISCPSK